MPVVNRHHVPVGMLTRHDLQPQVLKNALMKMRKRHRTEVADGFVYDYGGGAEWDVDVLGKIVYSPTRRRSHSSRRQSAGVGGSLEDTRTSFGLTSLPLNDSARVINYDTDHSLELGDTDSFSGALELQVPPAAATRARSPARIVSKGNGGRWWVPVCAGLPRVATAKAGM